MLQKFSYTCQRQSVALYNAEFFMARNWWFPSRHVKHVCSIQTVKVDSGLQLSISAKTMGILQAIQASITVRKKFPSLFPTAMLVKMSIRVVALAFVLCDLYYRSLCTQIFPSHLKDEWKKEELPVFGIISWVGLSFSRFFSLPPFFQWSRPGPDHS